MSYRDDDRYGSSRDRPGPFGDRDGRGELLTFLVVLSLLFQTTYICYLRLSILAVQLYVISNLTVGCLHLRFEWYR